MEGSEMNNDNFEEIVQHLEDRVDELQEIVRRTILIIIDLKSNFDPEIYERITTRLDFNRMTANLFIDEV
jgi:hypothetical protein